MTVGDNFAYLRVDGRELPAAIPRAAAAQG